MMELKSKIFEETTDTTLTDVSILQEFPCIYQQILLIVLV